MVQSHEFFRNFLPHPEFILSQLIRLVYASRSTIESSEKQQGLDPGVARILPNLTVRTGGAAYGEPGIQRCFTL